MDKWTEILDQGGSVDSIYLDFAKAFDTVPHRRLLLKLENYGVGGCILDWVGDILHGRRQRVMLAGVVSEWAEVISGVPQGLVEGPVLFVCYINDLPESITSRIYMYADDAT
jgi:ribonuclease P/MRP protein subunit RPP40